MKILQCKTAKFYKGYYYSVKQLRGRRYVKIFLPFFYTNFFMLIKMFIFNNH